MVVGCGGVVGFLDCWAGPFRDDTITAAVARWAKVVSLIEDYEERSVLGGEHPARQYQRDECC